VTWHSPKEKEWNLSLAFVNILPLLTHKNMNHEKSNSLCKKCITNKVKITKQAMFSHLWKVTRHKKIVISKIFKIMPFLLEIVNCSVLAYPRGSYQNLWVGKTNVSVYSIS
jgi:hypothetical protein